MLVSSLHSQQSEGLNINLELSSNNPFRNRTASPFDDPPARPLSRNPFLDNPPPPLKSPGAMSNNSEGTKSLSAEEIFNSLTLEDEKNLKAPMRPAPALPTGTDGANEGPEGSRRHRPNDSQEEAAKARRAPPPGVRQGPSASPHKRPPPQQRRPRRNSESSVADFDTMPLTEDEKRMIARRRERERQKRAEAGGRPPREARDAPEGGERRERREPRETREPREPREQRDPNQRSRSGRPNRRVDIIDQLDATGIYGTGLFHHDGPFDALNAHRNRKGRRAPMQAFPEGSLNNSLGGSGPLNRQPDHSSFLGQHGEEAFTDYSYKPAKSRQGAAQLFDPIARGEIVHGDQSEGLGTSTFLEGTPAARTAITRTLEEQARDQAETGLQRKKSLAQRIRHINKGPREYPSGRATNPEGAKEATSAGAAEANPFFAEYGKGEETFTVRSREGAMSPSSPPRRGSSAALERRATADGVLALEENSKPSGFLGRMKSLKGGRRPRNSNADSGPASPPANPGTAI
ncbi:Pal1 cell morphology protein [Emericellopsis atlantica]|uniref:Pal1 cell morphology protein n=1 Tax=Emericellopsis atlantica TaxID=2614577 RepID=A0A9P7ZUT9_9HYPO|nr:Pal1 cell morphology protein [Emericellopsis atlantica]KAG9258744.1 Pal1 cell morphology protein [Emericellopsis atlantica]